MTINIDEKAGFCPGVVRTVNNVESVISGEEKKKAYIIGEIIHNPQETERLKNMGLITITSDDLPDLQKDSTVIIRAHGEPPETYRKIMHLHLNFIDATCPLVRNLQKKVSDYYQSGYRIFIYGKKNHPEVIGLRGVCDDNCTVFDDHAVIPPDFDTQTDTVLLSQTTSDINKFNELANQVTEYFRSRGDEGHLKIENTICANVSSREEKLKEFVSQNDAVIFVAGRNSSNGKSLYNTCRSVSDKVYFIESEKELKKEWFSGAENIGITGATSTPKWFLHEIGMLIDHMIND